MTTIEAMLAGPDDRTQRLDRISARARRMHFGRALLGLAAVLLVGLGRLAFGVCAGVWLVATWCAAAVAEGWSQARATQAQRREAGG